MALIFSFLFLFLGIEIHPNGISSEKVDKPLTAVDNGMTRVKKETLNLKDFGVFGNGKDETRLIQKALNAAQGKILFIPKQIGQFYLVRQLVVPSNVEIICDSRVVFYAKNDLQQNFQNFEVMWRFEDAENVIFDGKGALFRMDKSKYKSEFNHIFMVNGGNNVTIKNIRADNSAGDGLYVGAIRTKSPYPRDIQILNCISTNSRRQGLSVTSVDGLTVLNSSFNYSKGTSPESGVDIEPFSSKGVLRRIKFINCKAIGNAKRGFMVNLMKLNKTSSPVDILFENCESSNNMEGFSNRSFEGVQGIVQLNGCIVKNSKFSGITENGCFASSIKKVYRDCTIENSNTLNKNTKDYLTTAGFYIRGNRQNKGIIGNFQLINCKVINDKNSQYGLYVDNGDVSLKGISVDNLQVKGRKIKQAHMPRKF